MASQKEPQRILSGRMNLIAARDKIADSDAAVLENFRVDQMGQLRSRLGAFKGFGPVGSGRFHTIKYAGNLIFGIGTEVRWGTAGQLLDSGFDGNPLGVAAGGGYTYIMNRAKQVRIAGASGTVPWCPEPPATGPTATPGNADDILLEAFDGTSGQVNVQTISDGVTEIDAMVSDAPVADADAAASFDGLNFQEGAGSLKLDIAGALTAAVRVDLGAGVDTRNAGTARDIDRFRVWLAFSDPTQVQSVTVTLLNAPTADAAQGKIVQVTLQPGTALDPSKILNQEPGSWTQLSIRRALNVDQAQAAIAAASTAVIDGTGSTQIVSDLIAQLTQDLQNPAFLIIAQQNPQILGANNTPPSAASAPDFDWSAVTSARVAVVTTGAVTMNVDAFDCLGATDAAVLSGVPSYYVTFVDDAGHESLPSPASADVTVNGQTVTLSAIPVSAASNIIARKIYRIGAGLSNALFLAFVWGNAATTWLDTVSNDLATAAGEVMPTDRTPPPAARGVIGPFFGKFIAFSTVDHAARYFWSPTGLYYCFPGQDDPDIGNWEDCGADEDDILTITDHKTVLVFYKRRSIWRLQGDPEKADPVRTNSNISAVGELAVYNAGNVDYLVAWEGVYRFNLDFEEKLSDEIDPIFKGDPVRLSSGDVLPPVDHSRFDQASIACINERLRVTYPEAGGGFVIAVLNLSTGAWAREKYTNLGAPNLTVLAFVGGGLALLAGGTASGGGYWYALEQPGIDDGGAIALKWQTRYFDQGLPDNFKWYSDLELEAFLALDNTAPVTLTVTALFNDGATAVSLGTMVVNSGRKTVQSFRIDEDTSLPIPAGGTDYGYRAKNVAIKVTGNAASEVIISGTYLHWYPEEREAHVFDSGSTDFGLPERVKQVDYFEGYFTGAGQSLTRILSSDLPGSLLTVRDTTALTILNGRSNSRARLASVVEGRNFRLTINDSANGRRFQAHQIRLRMRPIGEYIDGTQGEYYESPEFSIAPGRVGELKDFLLDYDASAAGGRVVIYSDLPGSSLAVRRTLALPYQSGRAPYVFPLEDFTDPAQDYLPTGQLFKVRIYPPPGGILRLHGRAQFRGRVLGVYFNGANGEVWECQAKDLFGGMAIAREMTVLAETAGAMTMAVFTELPNNDLRQIASFTVNSQPTTAGRLPISSRLPGNTKGQLWRFRLYGPYITRLFEVKIFGRRLQTNATPWDWVNVPMEPTPDQFANIPMPVRETPEEFTWIDLAPDPVG